MPPPSLPIRASCASGEHRPDAGEAARSGADRGAQDADLRASGEGRQSRPAVGDRRDEDRPSEGRRTEDADRRAADGCLRKADASLPDADASDRTAGGVRPAGAALGPAKAGASRDRTRGEARRWRGAGACRRRDAIQPWGLSGWCSARAAPGAGGDRRRPTARDARRDRDARSAPARARSSKGGRPARRSLPWLRSRRRPRSRAPRAQCARDDP